MLNTYLLIAKKNFFFISFLFLLLVTYQPVLNLCWHKKNPKNNNKGLKKSTANFVYIIIILIVSVSKKKKDWILYLRYAVSVAVVVKLLSFVEQLRSVFQILHEVHLVFVRWPGRTAQSVPVATLHFNF